MSYDNWKTTNPDDEFLGPPPEQWHDCPACGGEGYTYHRVTVYEPGCGFPHDDTEERVCEVCGGRCGYVDEAKSAPTLADLEERDEVELSNLVPVQCPCEGNATAQAAGLQGMPVAPEASPAVKEEGTGGRDRHLPSYLGRIRPPHENDPINFIDTSPRAYSTQLRDFVLVTLATVIAAVIAAIATNFF